MNRLAFSLWLFLFFTGLVSSPLSYADSAKTAEKTKGKTSAPLKKRNRAVVVKNRKQLQECVDKFFKPLIDNDWCVGCAVGVIGDDLQGTFSYGVVKREGEKVDDRTVFEIGSVSKVFTAILLQLMVDNGVVKLDDSIKSMLPAGIEPPRDKDGHTFTLQHLATQTSGLPLIPDNFAKDKITDPYAEYTDKELFEYLKHCKLPRQPGTQYEYSNLGMTVLGEMLARKAGKPYETLCVEKIFRPLGMNDTRVKLTPDMKKRFAQGYNADGVAVRPWEFDVFAPCGGWRSTCSDMMRFLALNLAQPLSKKVDQDTKSEALSKAVKKTHQLRFAMNKHVGMGLGWHIFTSSALVWHTGGTNGYASFIAFNVKKQIGIVVLANTGTNCSSFGVISEAGIGVLSELVGGSYTPPTKVRRTIKVPDNVLKTYVGRYTDGDKLSFSVSLKDNTLLVHFTGSPAMRLFPETSSSFFLKAVDYQIAFKKGDDGTVKEAVVTESGKITIVRREK